VTKKVGNDLEDSEVPLLQKTRKRLRDRVNFPEIGFSVFLFLCASYNLAFHGTTSYYIYLYLQGLAFLLLGLNFTGTCSCCQWQMTMAKLYESQLYSHFLGTSPSGYNSNGLDRRCIERCCYSMWSRWFDRCCFSPSKLMQNGLIQWHLTSIKNGDSFR